MKKVNKMGHQKKTMTEREIAKTFLKALVDEYNYSKDQIGIEHAIPIGRRLSRVDAVIFKTTQRKTPFILVEFKKDILYPLFTEQIRSYLMMSTAEYAILTNGIEKICFQKVKPGLILRVPDIPKRGEKGRIFAKDELIPPRNLEFYFEKILDYLWSNEEITTDDAFQELNKILLAKFVDEMMPGPEYFFRITPEEARAVEEGKKLKIRFLERIQCLFQKTRKKYPELFEKEQKIRMGPKSLAYIVSLLQPYSLLKISENERAEIHQKLIAPTFKRARGLYYTPSQIAEFIIEMLDPKKTDKIIDPACGTGSFLIKFLQKIWDTIDKNQYLAVGQKNRMKLSIAQNNIFGIDVNEKMVQIAKMNMIVFGNGHEGINCADALADLEEFLDQYGFDIVVTDPPLGLKIENSKILERYDLAKGRKSQDATVLFLERCIQLARSKGKIAIIVPDRILTNVSMNYVRKYLRENAEIQAIISLPTIPFAPYSSMKTSVLLLEKKSIPGKDVHDYQVFMAIADNIGYEKTGKPGKNDLFLILEKYRQFQRSKKLRKKEKPLIFQVKSTQLEKRLDVKYYDPEYFKLWAMLGEHVLKRLGDLAEIVKGISIPASKYRDEGLPYIRISNFARGGLDLSEAVRISGKGLKNIARAQLQGGEILISITGTIGKVAIVPEYAKGAIASSDIAIIKPRVSTISTFYLYHILASDLVEEQIKRVTMGQVIPRINLADLRSILIPIFPQSRQKEIEHEVKTLLAKMTELQMEQERIRRRLRRLRMD